MPLIPENFQLFDSHDCNNYTKVSEFPGVNGDFLVCPFPSTVLESVCLSVSVVWMCVSVLCIFAHLVFARCVYGLP